MQAIAATALVLTTAVGAIALSPWATRKVKLYIHAVIKLIKGPAQNSMQSIKPKTSLSSRKNPKRVILIRHGESVWNACFNPRSVPDALLRAPISFISALIHELSSFFDADASLLDSPLSSRGVTQAVELGHAIERSSSLNEPDRNAIVHASPSGNVCFVCSNLRRSAETLLLASRASRKAAANVDVHTSLQEVSRNLDTVALSSGSAVPSGATMLPKLPAARGYESCLNSRSVHNTGNVPLSHSAADRVDAFAKWAVTRSEHVIVASGHSIWFKKLFNRLLSDSKASDLARKACVSKIQNGGAVAVDLVTASDGSIEVDPHSITELHLGFAIPRQAKDKPAGRAKQL